MATHFHKDDEPCTLGCPADNRDIARLEADVRERVGDPDAHLTEALLSGQCPLHPAYRPNHLPLKTKAHKDGCPTCHFVYDQEHS